MSHLVQRKKLATLYAVELRGGGIGTQLARKLDNHYGTLGCNIAMHGFKVSHLVEVLIAQI